MAGISWLTQKTAKSRTEEEERALASQSAPPVIPSNPPTASSVDPRSALAIADAYACVRALSDAAATLPLHVYRRTSEGRERAEGRTASLLRRPAPAVTQAGLVGQMVAQLATQGNAFLGKFRGEEFIEQLGLLPPEAVQVEIKGGLPLYTFTNPHTGRQTTHTTADICHVKTLSTDGVVGLSPVRQCRVALGLSQSLSRHAAAFFDNSAIPAGLLRVKGGDAATQRFERVWHEGMRGADKAHRVAVVAGEVTFEPLTLNPDDAQFLEQRMLSAQEVARIFRVPPWVIGAPTGDSLTYSTVEQQGQAFITYSLRPYLVAIEQALSNDRDLFSANTYCEFLYDALLRADSLTRAQVYSAALDPATGWLNREEVRRMENLEPEASPRRTPTHTGNGVPSGVG